MTTYTDFLDRARPLIEGLNEDAQDLVADLLTRILNLEGPPPFPEVEGFQEAVIRHAQSNRGVFYAQTWVKGDWRCLLLNFQSIAMKREPTVFIGSDGTKQRRFDQRGLRVQKRIIRACTHFGIHAPIGNGVVAMTFNHTRTFVCWRPLSEAEQHWSEAIRGDVDNYAKTILDGLQKAGVLINDRNVVEARCSKVDPWGVPEESLRAYQARRLREALEEGVEQDALESLRQDLGASKRLLKGIHQEHQARVDKKAASVAKKAKSTVKSQPAAKHKQASLSPTAETKKKKHPPTNKKSVKPRTK